MDLIGPKILHSNYRAITLTSIFSKIFSHILDNRLRSYVETQNHLTDFQFGFRVNKSTIDCINILKSIIDCKINNKKKLYCSFIDFRKAFDLVYRNGIWFKLLEMGISQKFVNMIRKMYDTVKVCVKSMNSMSEFFKSYVGVKQGEPLSPLLFIIFINDMANDLLSNGISTFNINHFQMFMLLFADDTVLFADTLEELQILMDNLHEYCCKWNISVNITKTKSMVFKSGNRRENLNLQYDGSPLETVNTFTYLGMTLSSNGKFYQAQKALAEQATKALFSLNNLFDKIDLSISEKIKLFDSMILPILNYASEIWGFHPAPDIERVHLKFLKQILKVKSQTPSAAVYGELGRVPLHVMRKERILKYWFKVKCSTNTLLQETYLNEIHVAEQCHYPTSMSFWTIKVKQLLDNLGFTFLWDSEDITLLQVNQIIERLYDHFLQGWFGDLNNISKLSTYKCFKSQFCIEHYFDCVANEKHRIQLTRFRCSSHSLEIETARYNRNHIDRADRICKCCNMNMTEDEHHFLLICPAFSEIRRQHFPPYFCRWPTKQKFITLMTNQQAKFLKHLAAYIYEANVKRKSLLGY